MSDHAINKADIAPGPVMDESELQAWNSLNREEQVARTQEVLTAARESGLSDRTMEEIRLDARRNIATRSE